jgi:hypothetical protein
MCEFNYCLKSSWTQNLNTAVAARAAGDNYRQQPTEKQITPEAKPCINLISSAKEDAFLVGWLARYGSHGVLVHITSMSNMHPVRHVLQL